MTDLLILSGVVDKFKNLSPSIYFYQLFELDRSTITTGELLNILSHGNNMIIRYKKKYKNQENRINRLNNLKKYIDNFKL